VYPTLRKPTNSLAGLPSNPEAQCNNRQSQLTVVGVNELQDCSVSERSSALLFRIQLEQLPENNSSTTRRQTTQQQPAAAAAA
jgi:hypothetical protein